MPNELGDGGQVYLSRAKSRSEGGSGARSAVVRRSSARVPEYKRQPRMTQPKRHAAGGRQSAQWPAGDGRDGGGRAVAIGQQGALARLGGE